MKLFGILILWEGKCQCFPCCRVKFLGRLMCLCAVREQSWRGSRVGAPVVLQGDGRAGAGHGSVTELEGSSEAREKELGSVVALGEAETAHERRPDTRLGVRSSL